jgi:hypothetical protein
MAGERLRRFLRIERPRAEPAGPAAPPAPEEDARRFGVLERPGPLDDRPAAGTAGHLDRFRPAPEREPELLADDGGDALPFTRCAMCGADSGRFAAACERCGADFATDAQRALDVRLRDERRHEADRERAAAAAAAAERARVAAEERQAQRALGEALAERERLRFETEQRREGLGAGWSGWDGPHDPTPLGIRLLRLLPEGPLRVGAAIGVVVLAAAVLLRVGMAGRPGAALAAAVALLVVLLAPNLREL